MLDLMLHRSSVQAINFGCCRLAGSSRISLDQLEAQCLLGLSRRSYTVYPLDAAILKRRCANISPLVLAVAEQ